MIIFGWTLKELDLDLYLTIFCHHGSTTGWESCLKLKSIFKPCVSVCVFYRVQPLLYFPSRLNTRALWRAGDGQRAGHRATTLTPFQVSTCLLLLCLLLLLSVKEIAVGGLLSVVLNKRYSTSTCSMQLQVWPPDRLLFWGNYVWVDWCCGCWLSS